jgi:hypothetical protein
MSRGTKPAGGSGGGVGVTGGGGADIRARYTGLTQFQSSILYLCHFGTVARSALALVERARMGVLKTRKKVDRLSGLVDRIDIRASVAPP